MTPRLLRTRFSEIARQRPRALLSPFVDVDRPGPVEEELTGLGTGPRIPFCAVVLDLDDLDADGRVQCGLTVPGGPVLARLDGATRQLDLSVAGVVLAAAPFPEVPAGLACVVQENRVTVLVSGADGEWTPVLSERDAVMARLDLRAPAVLRSAEYCAAARGARVRRTRAGVSGPAGVRDPQVVRTADGRPLVRDGRLHVTMTSAGLGFFEQASWGVWALDLADPTRWEQVAALYSHRDGLLLGDHAGQLVVDELTGVTTVLVSSWGDHTPSAGVHVRHVSTREDLLTGVHVLETSRLTVPTDHSAWDPSLARIGGRWHLAFTECVSFGPPRYVFHPALAVTDSDDPTEGLTLVRADDGREQTEGTLLVPDGGRWLVLASDRDVAQYPVYDTRLRRVGALQAPYGSNIPHPMVVPGGTDGTTPWLVTFDGTPWREDLLGYGTHGDLVVMAGRPETLRETWERTVARGTTTVRRGLGVVRRRLGDARRRTRPPAADRGPDGG
ncbi:hypothetical protein JD79_02155 [Geodermatophilus normandii]|uniref:Uncharacterized protein n=1 Tax=Geodermatophilus normandii TaxID=1137989 RepID=A0A317QI38_9ACTN|nr:hypothetical protein [Geodermatophilus normandii]PWW22992.1 hypothetical protein JD79_02155 [Geodermatophilus normandii]